MSTADEKRALRMLLLDTNRHKIHVLRDEGLYRHIRFKRPGTAMYYFDLVTWPGNLVITGDLQDYHFARLSDMFEFFRNPVGYINPHYWAEKLCGHHQTYEGFSETQFKQRVFEYFRDWCEYHEGPHRPLWQAICQDVLQDSPLYDESAAHTALRDFRFDPLTAHLDHVQEVYESPVRQQQDFVPQFIPKARTASRRRRIFTGEVFQFTDSWEWHLRDYDYQFLVSLHAIVWGIHQYDHAKKRAPWPDNPDRMPTSAVRRIVPIR